MLEHIDVQDFAIIEHISVDLNAGLTVFTGETGAGKSILVEAVGLTLGDRADAATVRTGAKKAAVTTVFNISNLKALQDQLVERGLESTGNELVLRRQIDTDGKSRAFVNGTPVPVQLLRELGTHLIDVHAQHAHQSLLRRDIQRQLLDEYGGHEELLQTVAGAFHAWKDLNDRLFKLRASNPEQRSRDLETLKFQVRELEILAPEAEEAQELENNLKRLTNLARITELGTRIQQQLIDSDVSAERLLRGASRDLQHLLELDKTLQPADELLCTALTALDEAASLIRHYLLEQDQDPRTLEKVESRLSSLHDVARKHHCRIEELPELLSALTARLSELENQSDDIERLERQRNTKRADYAKAAAALHTTRIESAARMADLVTGHMHELGMPGGSFEVEVLESASGEPTPHGLDQVQFLVSANPGQPRRPLAKVASGGELSRISLAIQVVGASDNGVPSLVFDEIDVGIGGGIAEILGRKLRQLSDRRQILCVTHHAQVAALAHAHYKAHKTVVRGLTLPSVTQLDGDNRVKELARMLGGIKISQRALAHAQEMLAVSADPMDLN